MTRLVIDPNLAAFLDTLAYSEIGPKLLAKSDDGYNVIVGGTLFEGYEDHPRKLVDLPRLGIKSTAAGRYQLLSRYFDAYKDRLNLPDFSPESQDAIALQQIKECRAIDLIKGGRVDEAISRCARIWASLPGANYPGQHMQKIEVLRNAYAKAGGVFS